VRRQGLAYESGGLSRRAGNGIILFDPGSGGYHYLIHLQRGVLVRAGDVVRAGQTIGRVGHSGNASQPGHGKHLHYAFKLPGTACGVDGVLVSENPYPRVRDARRRMGAPR
jgi:murein DD-endopeptidase MepM/ murein hydrolase activator NlpD